MAKKKSPPDEFLDETPAELPERPETGDLAPGEVVDVNEGTPSWPPGDMGIGEPTPPPAPESQSAASEWTPPAGCVVGDDPEGARPFKIRVSGVLYRHVSNAPDGNWVYEPDV